MAIISCVASLARFCCLSPLCCTGISMIYHFFVVIARIFLWPDPAEMFFVVVNILKKNTTPMDIVPFNLFRTSVSSALQLTPNAAQRGTFFLKRPHASAMPCGWWVEPFWQLVACKSHHLVLDGRHRGAGSIEINNTAQLKILYQTWRQEHSVPERQERISIPLNLSSGLKLSSGCWML